MNVFEITREEKQKVKVNIVPCKIDYNGEISNSDKFYGKKEKTKNETYFRGRLLKGSEVLLPEGYKGIVVNSPENKNTEEVIKISPIAEFDKITVWGHHEEREKDSDKFILAISDWLEFSNKMYNGV